MTNPGNKCREIQSWAPKVAFQQRGNSRRIWKNPRLVASRKLGHRSVDIWRKRIPELKAWTSVITTTPPQSMTHQFSARTIRTASKSDKGIMGCLRLQISTSWIGHLRIKIPRIDFHRRNGPTSWGPLDQWRKWALWVKELYIQLDPVKIKRIHSNNRLRIKLKS